MVKHIEYGVMVTTDAGHTFLDTTHRTVKAAEEHIRFSDLHGWAGERKVMQREVEVILGEWEPVDETPAHEHKCASEGYADHEPGISCICCICGKRFDGSKRTK